MRCAFVQTAVIGTGEIWLVEFCLLYVL